MSEPRPHPVLPPAPRPPGLAWRMMQPLWWVADVTWIAPASALRILKSLPTSLRRLPEGVLDLGVSALLLGFRRPVAILSVALLATAGPIAVASPLFRNLEPAKPAADEVPSPPPPRRDRDLASRPAPPPPPELVARLASLDPGFRRPVGIAVMDVESGWIAASHGDQAFPQQSVSKLWVALTVMDQVDSGRLSLDQTVILTDADRSVFNQPVAHLIENGIFETTLRDLIRRALIQSDNAANDKLMALAGGPATVQAFLTSRGMSGIRLAEDERRLQSRIAGLTWSPDLSAYGAFEATRARLDPEVRAASLAAYVERPFDGATPAGVVRALAALQRGELLSPESSDFILQTLGRVKTGPMRLRGGLSPGWRAAHKTGTGQDFRGETFGLNDVGLVTAPDGRVYAVAVLAPQVPKGSPLRLRVFQNVSSTLVSHWRIEVAAS
ncbi:MAG: serine hydrolase, partial [Phenylobacterium sp.]|nr:serine hydrolase [Phenylobacterium sp.]